MWIVWLFCRQVSSEQLVRIVKRTYMDPRAVMVRVSFHSEIQDWLNLVLLVLVLCSNCCLCYSVCSCKNGICASGVKGTGQCTCLSGYTGIDCDRGKILEYLCACDTCDIVAAYEWGCFFSAELQACAALRCGPNSRCIEDMSTGQLLCRCKPGYQGDGTQCTCEYTQHTTHTHTCLLF